MRLTSGRDKNDLIQGFAFMVEALFSEWGLDNAQR